jgi:hypothetical protein
MLNIIGIKLVGIFGAEDDCASFENFTIAS